MKTPIFKIIILLLCFMNFVVSLSAQVKKEATPKETSKSTTKQVHVDLKDGSSVEGKLIARRGDTVVIESATLGVLNLHIKNIKNIDALNSENLKNGQNWFENIHAPHNYFSPTAFNLRKGEGYYGNIFLFFNQVGYGFTDHFSLSGGTELISLLFSDGGDRSPQFFYLNPKFSYQVDKSITLGVGAFILWGSEIDKIPLPYGVVTLGNRNNNVSLAIGAPLVSGGGSAPVFSISGQARIARGICLMSENHIINESGVGTTGIGTSGFRFMSKSIAFNVGFMYSINSNGDFFDTDSPIVPFPFLGLNVPFGQKKK